jgi:ribosomal protein S18 acetylase RimI-like enzyme
MLDLTERLAAREYHDEDDYWRVRAFLRAVLLLNDRRTPSWEVARWDYWRWHIVENIVRQPPEALVTLWEDTAGEVRAVLNVEEPGDLFLSVHPAHNTPALLDAMLDVAEAGQSAGAEPQRVWASERDTEREAALARRGYAPQGRPEHMRRRRLDAPVAAVTPAAGYLVRALGDEAELPARSWLSWQVFHPDEPDDRYQGWTWYRNVQRAPLYRRDLDLVAVAPSGELAAFCTVWFDDVTRTGIFEPVGTAPAHQRRGLGRAVMTEGLRRLQCLGATLAYVGSYGPRAHALYEAVGFTDVELLRPWVKAA